MEKLFYPNKWFVGFCGLLVLVWAGLQWVVNMRIADEAKIFGEHIFSWSWDDHHWRSRAQITKADVLRRTSTDAIVKIEGRQVLSEPATGNPSEGQENQSEVVDCSATLTLYKMSGQNPRTKQIEDYWVLGKVELK